MSSSKIMTRFVGVIAAAALSVGIGGVAAAPANAASNVWDRVAACESGGNWQINTGNGYYGGLQFSRATWNGYGGGTYASTANRATKAQQIAIARRTLQGQGPGAWPVCSRRAGLTRSNGGANSNATASTNSGSSRYTAPKSVAKKSTTATKKYAVSKSTRTVTVKRGDTLSKLANRYGVTGGWRGMYSLNRNKVSNPNLIYVGQSLTIRK